MPAGISQSTVNPAALVPRAAQPTQRAQEPAAADAQNAQAVLANGSEELVRAPEPDTGSQRADNQLESTPTGTGPSEQATPGGAPAPPEQQLEVEVNRGLGGNVDITV